MLSVNLTLIQNASKLEIINTICNFTIKDLVELITYLNIRYYSYYESIVDDSVYDNLIEQLKILKPSHPLLSQIDSPLLDKAKVKLPFHMGSMDKLKPENTKELERWKTKFSSPYIVSEKLDGISGLLVVRDHRYYLYTRGKDGKYGTNLTGLTRFLVKHTLPNPKHIPNCTIRGELIIPKHKFYQYKESNPDVKHSRNVAGGVLLSKHPKVEVLDILNFVAYEVVQAYDKKGTNVLTFNVSEQIAWLKRYKFKIVWNQVIIDIDPDQLSKILRKQKASSEYDIDGIVVYHDYHNKRNISGNPVYAFAFKETFSEQIETTTVINIEWNVSKHGYFKPTVIVYPIVIGGVEIQRVTGHNAKYIKDHCLGKGAVVEIVRSGDVIPKIHHVIEGVEPEFPITAYYWNETNVDILSTNLTKSQTLNKILYFFKTMDVKHIGSKTVSILIDLGYDTVYKVLLISKAQLLEIEGFRERKTSRFLDTIKELKTKPIHLGLLMTASNCFPRGVAGKKIDIILQNYPGIEEEIITHQITCDKLDEIYSQILLLKGFRETTAKKVIASLLSFQEFLKSVGSQLNIIRTPLIEGSDEVSNEVSNEGSDEGSDEGSGEGSGYFNGMKICFSGFRSKPFQQYVITQGGEIVNTVTKSTDLVVTGNKPNKTGKIKKAEALLIKIITIDEFKEMITS